MSLTLRWVGEDELDRVADTRARCYASAGREIEHHRQRIRADQRCGSGDYLLAERGGAAVGTITSIPFKMWVRGKPVSCQGIAFVGTIKTARRAGKSGERGVASQVMHAALNLARQRGDVVSALMPFRASYYEHFGYGMVEHRNEWTLPLTTLPPGEFDGIRFAEAQDLPMIQVGHQRAVEAGQCALERSAGGWNFFTRQWPNGIVILDETSAGVADSWLFLTETIESGKSILRVSDGLFTTPAALLRLLHFLHSLRDQHTAVIWSLPGDLPLNWLLREVQLPHRLVEHATARVEIQNRLQLRVLDHTQFLDGQVLSVQQCGRAVVRIRECEQNECTVEIELDAGRISARPSAQTPDVVAADRVWASIACGDISASTFARLGLIEVDNPAALATLDALKSGGRAPFCSERF